MQKIEMRFSENFYYNVKLARMYKNGYKKYMLELLVVSLATAHMVTIFMAINA